MAQKSKIYTRTGDNGTTSLANGQRVPKDHIRLEAYGTIDELNAHLGLLQALWTEGEEKQMLLNIQHTLFDIGAILATPGQPDKTNTAPGHLNDALTRLEKSIDELDENLPALRAFILPTGNVVSAQCHVCRTVCRRAERRILSLAAEAQIAEEILSYINRLSDFLFILARKANFNANTDEIIWQRYRDL